MQQDELNEMMRELGIRRSQQRVASAKAQGEESRTRPGQVLESNLMEPLHEAIVEWRRRLVPFNAPKKGSRGQNLQRLLDEIPDIRVVAPLTIRTIIDCLSKPQTAMTVGHAIASNLVDEIRFARFKGAVPEEYKWAKMAAAKNNRGNRWKREILYRAAKKAGVHDVGWGRAEKYDVGIHLLTIFAEVTGLVELRALSSIRGHGKGSRVMMCVPQPSLLQWLEDAHGENAEREPLYLPMVDVPWDWTGPFDGGYPDTVYMRWPIVKQKPKYAKLYTRDRIPEVYDAINYVQKTAWRINADVFQVFDHFWKTGIERAGLPPREDKPTPPRPANIDEDEDALKKWRKEAAITRRENLSLKGKRMLHARIHDIARQFHDERIYFPHSADFRGRIYPLASSFLHPQGCKLARGLLHFDEGLRLHDQEAVRWFFIHGSNCWGMDKEDMLDRISWVTENHDAILKIGLDPIAEQGWCEADDPWGFLAWCMEYCEWVEDPEGFKSRIAVGQDHTNSGLQLYALIRRDTPTAIATNVAPTEKPEDTYAKTGEEVTRMLKEFIAKADTNQRSSQQQKFTDVQYAQSWLDACDGLISRAVTKRSVMTYTYSATEYSSRDYLEEYIRERVYDDPEWARPEPMLDMFWASKFLVGIVRTAIEEVSPAAAEAMEFLRGIAKAYVKAGQDPRWTSPLGLEVVQESRLEKTIKLTGVGKVRIGAGGLAYKSKTDSLSLRKAQNGIAPNFIHTLDSTLMMKVALRLKAQGVHHCSMIHDDYRTHAAHSSTLARETREVVVEMFADRDYLQEIHDEARANLPDAMLPPVPALGDFDIHTVLDSEYLLS